MRKTIDVGYDGIVRIVRRKCKDGRHQIVSNRVYRLNRKQLFRLQKVLNNIGTLSVLNPYSYTATLYEV